MFTAIKEILHFYTSYLEHSIFDGSSVFLIMK